MVQMERIASMRSSSVKQESLPHSRKAPGAPPGGAFTMSPESFSFQGLHRNNQERRQRAGLVEWEAS